MTYGIIYKILDTVNWKVYIGQSISPVIRWRRHKSEAKKIYPELLIDEIIKKYGYQNFNIKLIDYANNSEDLAKLETYWINFFDSMNPEFGYNKKSGTHHRPEVGSKVSQAKKIIFNAAQVSQIVNLYLHKLSLNNIAKEFNVDRCVIVRILKENKLYQKSVEPRNKIKLSERQIINIKQLYSQKIPILAISRSLNLTASIIIRILKEQKVYIRKNKLPAHINVQQEQFIINLRQSGETLSKIAKQFNIGKDKVVGILIKHNAYIKCIGAHNKIVPHPFISGQIVKLRRSGIYISRIAKNFKLTPDVVVRILKENNAYIKTNGAVNKIQFTFQQREQILKLRFEGNTLQLIANTFHVSRDVICRILQEAIAKTYNHANIIESS